MILCQACVHTGASHHRVCADAAQSLIRLQRFWIMSPKSIARRLFSIFTCISDSTPSVIMDWCSLVTISKFQSFTHEKVTEQILKILIDLRFVQPCGNFIGTMTLCFRPQDLHSQWENSSQHTGACLQGRGPGWGGCLVWSSGT